MDKPPVLYVSRKGTASTDIDADPAFRKIYEHRARLARQRWRVLAWMTIVAAFVAVAVFATMGR